MAQPEQVEKAIPPRALKEAAKFIDWLVFKGLDREEAAAHVRTFVSAVAGKRPAKALLPEDGRGGAQKAVMARYVELYIAMYGEPPQIASTEWMHVARLLGDYSTPVVISRLEALARYCKEDQFMGRLGFTPGTLRNQWARVAAYAQQHRIGARRDAPADCRHTPRCQDAFAHTQKMLQDHRPPTP